MLAGLFFKKPSKNFLKKLFLEDAKEKFQVIHACAPGEFDIEEGKIKWDAGVATWCFDSHHEFVSTLKHIANRIKLNLDNNFNFVGFSMVFNFEKLPAELNQYNPNDAQCIVDALIRNPKLAKLICPEWLFNDEQKQLLHRHLEPRVIISRKKQATIKYKAISTERNLNYIVLAALFLGLISITGMIGITGLSWIGIIKAFACSCPLAMVGGFLGNLLFKRRSLYFDNAAKHYDAENLNETLTQGEIDALNIGIEAQETWGGYVKSYFKLPAYANYKAFAGAFNHALHNDAGIVDQIKSFKVN